MELRQILGRFAATIIGIVGAVLGLVFNFGYSFFHDALKIAGAKNIDATHGFVGLMLMLIALVGAFLALFRPRASAAMLAIGGVGFFYPVGFFALVASPFLLLASALAFVDRTKTPAKQPVKVQ